MLEIRTSLINSIRAQGTRMYLCQTCDAKNTFIEQNDCKDHLKCRVKSVFNKCKGVLHLMKKASKWGWRTSEGIYSGFLIHQLVSYLYKRRVIGLGWSTPFPWGRCISVAHRSHPVFSIFCQGSTALSRNIRHWVSGSGCRGGIQLQVRTDTHCPWADGMSGLHWQTSCCWYKPTTPRSRGSQELDRWSGL